MLRFDALGAVGAHPMRRTGRRMQVRSLGYRTDLLFPAFDGEILARRGHLAIRTPSNPSFYWGNFLLYAQPPGEGDAPRWREDFRREIGSPPAVLHETFGWDSPEGDTGHVEPFLRQGFRLSRSLVLTCREPPQPSSPPPGIEIRILASESDWQQAVACQVACREPGFDEQAYLDFRTRAMARYRRMAEAGRGGWFGAFFGDRLVADLGVFHGSGLGRYQSVETHPEFRRRGIAGHMVRVAGHHAMLEHGLRTLVIVAEEGSDAARLYLTLGFQHAEVQVGLERWPEMEPADGTEAS
jgi:GNAT superfamily N-acetyltransferase